MELKKNSEIFDVPRVPTPYVLGVFSKLFLVSYPAYFSNFRLDIGHVQSMGTTAAVVQYVETANKNKPGTVF